MTLFYPLIIGLFSRGILYFQSQSPFYVGLCKGSVVLLLIRSKHINTVSDVSMVVSMIRLSSNESNNGQLHDIIFDTLEKKKKNSF